MSPKSDEILVAKESFASEVDGELYTVNAGVTRVHGDHPLAKANPDFFEPVDQSVSYDVEQATASPGEKRRRSRSRAKKSKAKAEPAAEAKSEPPSEQPKASQAASAKAEPAGKQKDD